MTRSVIRVAGQDDHVEFPAAARELLGFVLSFRPALTWAFGDQDCVCSLGGVFGKIAS